MNYAIELTDDAWDDALHAVNWYDKQKQGLGDIFIEHLHEALQKISNNPSAYKKIFLQLRQAALQKFPYVILYKIEKNIVIVHCIFHTSQNPKKKIRRLKK